MPLNTSTVYPNTAQNPNTAAKNYEAGPKNYGRSYFSPIPRAVWDLRRAHHLTPRDVDVLGLLLDYKVYGSPIVAPEQAELAERLDCSTDTISRSVARLRRAGLMVTQRQRDLRGRQGRLEYDLSAVLALMPAQAAKMRCGQWGQPFDGRPSTTPQICGLSEERDSDVVRNNTCPVPDPRTPAPKGVVPKRVVPKTAAAKSIAPEQNAPEQKVREETSAALQQAGVFAAPTLVGRYGPERCRAVLSASARVPHFRQSRAAWIASALRQSWPLPAPVEEARPRAHWPYRLAPGLPAADPPSAASPSAASPSAADPLTVLAPDLYAALETRALAELWEETLPACRETLLGRKNPAGVRPRMRRLLAAPP